MVDLDPLIEAVTSGTFVNGHFITCSEIVTKSVIKEKLSVMWRTRKEQAIQMGLTA